uniref:Putative serine carboxypeptidase n=1 Tax=Ixodes ricinus TaxID=34613 RepID=V5ID76_IXORI
MRFFILAAFLTSSLNSSVSRALNNVADPRKLPHTQDTKRETLINGLNNDGFSKYLPESKAYTETVTSGYQDEPRQDGSLLLSSYIKEGKIEDAKRDSRVPFFYEMKGVEAFSGFIAINEDAQTNYYFLHTKIHVLAQIAQIVRKPPPLILWLSGGLGVSSLMAQFLYNGPVAVDATGHIRERVNSLANFADVIYLDQPAGTGFSFAAK